MESQEEKYCPLLSGRGGPELCRGEYCAWCTRLEVYPGRVLHGCAVTDLASSLRVLANEGCTARFAVKKPPSRTA